MPVTGIITINGVKYPIENFTITWDNNLQPSWLTGDPTIHFYNPYEETEEQRDRRLNPRKYDTCKFCDHYRFRHMSGYLECTSVDIDYTCELEDICECKEFR